MDTQQGSCFFLPVFTTCNTHFLPHVIQKHWGLQETTNPLHMSLCKRETIIFILLFSMHIPQTLNVYLCRCSPSKRPVYYVYHGWTDLEWKQQPTCVRYEALEMSTSALIQQDFLWAQVCEQHLQDGLGVQTAAWISVPHHRVSQHRLWTRNTSVTQSGNLVT